MLRIGWIAGVLLLLACGAPAARAATPDYFTFPAGYSVDDWGVTADGAGNVWFTAKGPTHVSTVSATQPTPSLARLIPAQASPGTSNGIAFFPLPDPTPVNCCANQVKAVTFNPKDGKLYYVRNDGGIGYGTPAALVPGTTTGLTVTTLPAYQDMLDVAPSPAGGVWFTEYGGLSNTAPFYGNRIAYYNGGPPLEGPNIAIQDGNTQLNDQRYDAKPSGIAVEPGGRPWFVEEEPGLPGYRVATYSGTGSHYDEYLVTPCAASPPCSGSNTGTGLTDVTIAPDGGIWFTNVLKRTFGRFDPSTLTMVQYTMASIAPALASSTPRQITTAPDGTLWMTAIQSGYNQPGNALVRIVPSATPTVSFTSLDNLSPPLGIAADNAGNIWFGVSSVSPPSKVGRLAGVVGVTPAPATPDPGQPAPATPAPAPPVVPPNQSIVLKPATIGTAKLDPPQTGNGAVNTNQICVGPPEARCSLVYLIKEHEYVTGFPSSVNKKKHLPRVLGTKTVTLHGGQHAKVTVKLNSLGKRILKGKHKLKIVFTATQKLANGKTKTITKKTLTLRSH
jgi:streptogramin lyase